jgi:ethanolamine utilization protein EutS
MPAGFLASEMDARKKSISQVSFYRFSGPRFGLPAWRYGVMPGCARMYTRLGVFFIASLTDPPIIGETHGGVAWLKMAEEDKLLRIIQEYVPGKQVTIAHVIANPDRELCQRVGLEDAEAVGILTVTPGESTIIACDLALKAADVQIGFLDRFSGTLVLTGELSAVETALQAVNDGLQEMLGFHPTRVTRR